MSLTERSIAGFLQLSCSHVLLAMVRIAVIAVLARLISPQDFGTAQAAMIVIALTEGLAHLNLGAALVQIRSLRSDHVASALTFALLSGCLTGVCIGVGAQPIAAVFKMPKLANALALLSWTIPANAVATVACAVLQRDLRYRQIATVEVASYLLGFGGVGLALAFLDWGYWALVAAAIAHFICRSAGFFVLVVPTLEGRPSWNGLGQLMRFGGGFSVAAVLNQLALRGDQIIIGRCLGNHMLGIYSRAYGVMNTSVSVLGKVMDLVAFSSMSRKQTQLGTLSLAYQRSLAAVALVMLPASALAVVLGPEIIDLLLGATWTSAVVPFQVLAAGIYFRVAYKISGALARSLGKVYSIACRQAVYLALIVGGTWTGHFWGLEGASAGVVLAVVGHYISLGSMASRLLPEVDWRRITMATLPGAVLAISVFVVASVVAETARYYQCSGLIVCFATCLATTLFLAALVHAYPPCLGQHGYWIMAKIVREHFPAWLRRTQPCSGKARATESGL